MSRGDDLKFLVFNGLNAESLLAAC